MDKERWNRGKTYLHVLSQMRNYAVQQGLQLISMVSCSEMQHLDP